LQDDMALFTYAQPVGALVGADVVGKEDETKEVKAEPSLVCCANCNEDN
jgi:hypothetical protein